MASPENSFDLVSQLNLQEIDNAVNQTRKETSTRFDLKSAHSNLEFYRQDKKVVITTTSEYALKSVIDVLNSKLIKRGVSLKALRFGRIEEAAGGQVRQEINFIQGIPLDKAREISKILKDRKLKININIEGEKIRVSSRSKDTLQEVMALLRKEDFGIPLQFTNFR